MASIKYLITTFINTLNYPDEKIIRKRKLFYFIVVVFILIVNAFWYYYTSKNNFFVNQKREATTGLSYDNAKQFFYFFYYTGYFPLATLNDSLDYSLVGAYNEIKKNGKDLIMEYNHWSRLGENLRIITFYPNAIIKGSPENPSVKLFNAIVFVLAQLILFSGFFFNKKGILGAFIVVVTMFTPYFIYEIYVNQNIFGLLGSTFMITLGLLFPFLFRREKKSLIYIIFSIVISGILIGLMSEMRGEIIVVAASAILIVLFSKERKFLKVIFLLLFIFSLFETKNRIRTYFDKKFDATYKLVVKYGGHPYSGKRIKQHRFWHPVFCGLGDFDKKYGYKWNDKVAYNYAIPVLKEKYGLDLKYSGKYYLDQYYDKDSLYYVKFDEIDEYEEVVKEKVLLDIKNDPLWYLKILFFRLIRILHVTAPFYWLGIPFLIILFIFIKERQYELLLLLVSSLPLSLTPFLIYSGGNATLNSFFPEITLGIILCFFSKYFFAKRYIRA